jgi:hypothetical protein
MAKKTLSIRLPPDTYERFEEYRDANSSEESELSKADAGRRLLEKGLDGVDGDTDSVRKRPATGIKYAAGFAGASVLLLVVTPVLVVLGVGGIATQLTVALTGVAALAIAFLLALLVVAPGPVITFGGGADRTEADT